MQHYISEVAKIIGTSNQMHSKALVYLLSGFGVDMHPEVAIYARRAIAMRRAIALWPAVRQQIKDIFRLYKQRNYFGIHNDSLDLAKLSPIPPHGYQQRQSWRHDFKPKGPVGLFLQQSHFHACTLDLDQFVLHSHQQPQIHLLQTPWQQLPGLLHDVAINAIFQAEAPHRTALHGAPNVDHQIFCQAVRKLDTHSCNGFCIVSYSHHLVLSSSYFGSGSHAKPG
eukprot:12343202-Karenia_brevis.AAC.1